MATRQHHGRGHRRGPADVDRDQRGVDDHVLRSAGNAAALSTRAESFAEVARDAARRFGTPLYLYDLAQLRADAAAVRDAFPDPWLRLYALKANALPPLVAEIAAAGGFHASAVSRGEVALATRAGVPVARIVLEGIGKTDADMDLAVSLAARGTPLAWVSLESEEDAAALARAAAKARRTLPPGRRLDVLVRVNPEVVPETHAGLAVGAADSKFGVLPEELNGVITAGGGTRGPLRWRGIHLHVGSQLGAIDSWRAAARIGLRLVHLQRGALHDFDTLNFGGGFPVAYESGAQSVPSAAHFASAIAGELDDLPADARPARLAVEPGRAVVAASCWLVARVLHVRRRERQIVVLDAGMTELVRPAMYGALHAMRALTSNGLPTEGVDPASSIFRVDGPICESTDSLGTTSLPPLIRGDVVSIEMAGAYGSSMFSTYNGRSRPPEIAWDGERLITWRRRGSLRTLP